MKSFKSIDNNSTIRYINENGLLHREDGPAYEETSGYRVWYINGERHREDGPARIWSDGEEWHYLNGKEYSKEDWEEEIVKIKLKRIKDL